MAERYVPPGKPETIKEIGTDILESCRLYRELHECHPNFGITAQHGGYRWKVLYWPEAEKMTERLSITRGELEQADPISYTVQKDGTVMKYEAIESRSPEGLALFDATKSLELADVDELIELRDVVAIVHTANG
jgi:hypothetical protein